MDMKQIYNIVNNTTKEYIGTEDLLQEDLSNIVDVGNQISGLSNLDHYVHSLVDHIGKVVFANRVYSGATPSVLMDGWEYGAILEKITYDGLPEAEENESWNLTDGAVYEQDKFTKPTVSAKFYNKRVTFDIPMSFAERQVKSAFDSITQLNAFFGLIENAIQKSMTVKTDSLVMRTINNAIAETLGQTAPGIKAVNLLSEYNSAYSTSYGAEEAIHQPEFIRYASYKMGLVKQRLSRLSTLFNIGAKERFTSSDKLHFILLSEFKAAADAYLQSDTYHNEFTSLPKAEAVPYWQGSGKDYSFDSTSTINVKTTSGKEVEQSGIIGVMFDRDALGVCNMDPRVTTHFNGRAEFYNNWYKFDAGYFNDFNENCVVFYLDEESSEG